jgi:hypothetical protein
MSETTPTGAPMGTETVDRADVDLVDEERDARDEGRWDARWVDLGADSSALAQRWNAIQAGFVDEPRQAVQQADALVADVIQRLADSFASQRQRLEEQWTRGEEVSTEDLRVVLRRYREFFQQLLA